MKPDELYHNLKNIADKFGITVSEQNLRISGLKVKSGLCKVKGDNVFIMDKHKSIREKIELLASRLSTMPLENIFIVPGVREILEKYMKQNEKGA